MPQRRSLPANLRSFLAVDFRESTEQMHGRLLIALPLRQDNANGDVALEAFLEESKDSTLPKSVVRFGLLGSGCLQLLPRGRNTTASTLACSSRQS